jgi:biopolymer transport protein ExbB/TolQ
MKNRKRLLNLGLFFVLGILFVVLLNIILPAGSDEAKVLIAKYKEPAWISIQLFIWIAFFVGIGDCLYRYFEYQKERKFCGREEIESIFGPQQNYLIDSPRNTAIYLNVRDKTRFRLHRLIRSISIQFQTTKSPGDCNSFFNSSMELMQHELEINYNLLRYIVWVLPTLGFIGTVVGISGALVTFAKPEDPPSDASASLDLTSEKLILLTEELGVAFDTTLLALVLSGFLVLFMNLMQESEEKLLNAIGQICLNKYVNRLLPSTQAGQTAEEVN